LAGLSKGLGVLENRKIRTSDRPVRILAAVTRYTLQEFHELQYGPKSL